MIFQRIKKNIKTKTIPVIRCIYTYIREGTLKFIHNIECAFKTDVWWWKFIDFKQCLMGIMWYLFIFLLLVGWLHKHSQTHTHASKYHLQAINRFCGLFAFILLLFKQVWVLVFNFINGQARHIMPLFLVWWLFKLI